MNERVKITLRVSFVTMIFMLIGIVLLFNGINNSKTLFLILGILIIVISFIVGSLIIKIKVTKLANEKYKRELSNYYKKNI